MSRKIAIALLAVSIIAFPDRAAHCEPGAKAGRSGLPAVSAAVKYNLSLIEGNWESEFGALTLKATPIADGTFKVAGFWLDESGKGVIQSGNFDPVKGRFLIAYCQTWDQVKGQAEFKLSHDKRVFNGTYKQGEGVTGAWELKRPSNWRPARPPKGSSK